MYYHLRKEVILVDCAIKMRDFTTWMWFALQRARYRRELSMWEARSPGKETWKPRTCTTWLQLPRKHKWNAGPKKWVKRQPLVVSLMNVTHEIQSKETLSLFSFGRKKPYPSKKKKKNHRLCPIDLSRVFVFVSSFYLLFLCLLRLFLWIIWCPGLTHKDPSFPVVYQPFRSSSGEGRKVPRHRTNRQEHRHASRVANSKQKHRNFSAHISFLCLLKTPFSNTKCWHIPCNDFWSIYLWLFPLILQSTENQKDWYKNMYKSLHKTEKPKGESWVLFRNNCPLGGGNFGIRIDTFHRVHEQTCVWLMRRTGSTLNSWCLWRGALRMQLMSASSYDVAV